MGLVARVFRLSGPTHGCPPCSFPLTPGGVVPMVPDLISSHPPSECLASELHPYVLDLPVFMKLASVLPGPKLVC
jgi:hypothetical protein